MANPTLGDVHVSAALSNISIAYLQNQNAYVADKVFPVVPVMKQSDKYHIFTKNDWFRDDAVEKRAPGTESPGTGFGLSTATYSADVFATHYDLPMQILANADPSIDIERSSVEFITQKMLIRRERQFASDYMTTSVWDTDVVGNTDFTYWDNYGASDPVTDINNGVETILKNTGFKPNTFVVGYQVHSALKSHPLVVDRFKYTSAESITNDMLARFLGVDRYLVAEAIYATNEEGATAAYDFALGKNALLCYSAPAPSIMMPSAGYTFTWSALTDVNDAGAAIYQYPMAHLRATRIEGEWALDMKAVATDLGYFFSGATSS